MSKFAWTIRVRLRDGEWTRLMRVCKPMASSLARVCRLGSSEPLVAEAYTQKDPLRQEEGNDSAPAFLALSTFIPKVPLGRS